VQEAPAENPQAEGRRESGRLLAAEVRPERCHELSGADKGTFSMDVKQPYRLLFKPIELESH